MGILWNNAEKGFFWAAEELEKRGFAMHIPILVTLFTVYKYPQNIMIKWSLHVYDPWNILSW